jgi:hypothetical protein
MIVVYNTGQLYKEVCSAIKKYGVRADLNYLDISRITSLDVLFNNVDFNGDISRWDVSNVTSMSSMFMNSNFNGDIGGWDTTKVINMCGMFNGLVSIKISAGGM